MQKDVRGQPPRKTFIRDILRATGQVLHAIRLARICLVVENVKLTALARIVQLFAFPIRVNLLCLER